MKKRFGRAVDAAGLRGLWFHDLRRSFITRARRVGVPESVVMKMSGHRTRAVFERYNVVDTRTCERQCARSRILDTPPETPKPHRLSTGRASAFRELRGQDLNLRPSGYEPDELPGCSTPRRCVVLVPTWG